MSINIFLSFTVDKYYIYAILILKQAKLNRAGFLIHKITGLPMGQNLLERPEGTMKKLVISISLIMLTVFIFRCSNEQAIRETISAWEAAIDDKNASDLKETLSPDSNWYIDADAILDDLFTNYFNQYKDVEYSNLDIDIDQPYANVLPGTTIYTDTSDLPLNIPSKFKMKKEEGLLSFISPDWRVYKYWDDANDDGVFDDSDFLWQKLKVSSK